MKFILKIVILILIALALVVFIKPLSTMAIKPVVEHFAAKALPNGASIEAIDLSGILGGNIRIEGIKLHNVDGFEAAEAVTLSSVDLDVDLNSIFSNEIVIKRLQLGNIQLNSEFSNFKNNFALLLADLQKTSSGSSPATTAMSKDASDDSAAKTVTIEKIFVASVEMHQQGCDETIAITNLHVPSVKAVSTDKVVLSILRPILKTGGSNIKSMQSCLTKGLGKVKGMVGKLKSLF